MRDAVVYAMHINFHGIKFHGSAKTTHCENFRVYGITLRAPVPLSKTRARATDEEVMNHYFDLLETTFQQYDLVVEETTWLNF